MAKTERKRTFYFVPYGYGFQHGTDIIEKKMTLSEFKEINKLPYYERGGAYFDKYIAAVYYTQD